MDVYFVAFGVDMNSISYTMVTEIKLNNLQLITM